MPSFANRLQELITRNVETVLEAATSPTKMLRSLQREIEEAIIAAEGERSRAGQRKTRLEAQIVQNELREGEWDEKAKKAMEHGREDLARQALMAREGCLAALAKARQDLAKTHSELADIEKAMAELEAQRTEAIERARAQAEVDAANPSEGAGSAASIRAEALRSRIAELQKRSEFIIEQITGKAAPASDGEEIDEAPSKRRIDIEIEAMRRARGAGSGSPQSRGSSDASGDD